MKISNSQVEYQTPEFGDANDDSRLYGKGVNRLVLGSIVWHVCRQHKERVKQWLLTELVGVFEKDDGIFKNEPGRRVATAAGLVIKERTPLDGKSILRFGLRRSGAYRAYKLGYALIAHNITTPQPVAWATVRYMGLRIKDYIITEELGSSVTLPERLQEIKGNNEQREKLIRLMGELLAAFHSNGFSNRDLKGGNVLVTNNGVQKLWVVDMDGVCCCRRISRWRAGRDFGPMIRELEIHCQPSASDVAILLAAYNEAVPNRLKRYKLPRM